MPAKTLTPERVTIMDVARKVGLSKATVSKALSLPDDRCPVNPETRQRIRIAAAQLGYHPGWLATALNRGRTGVIALLYCRSAPPMTGQYWDIVSTLHAGLGDAGCDLVFQQVADDEAQCRELLRSRRYDGFIALEHVPAALAAALAAHPVPFVRLNAPDGSDDLPYVAPDEEQACGVALDHLTGLGHRRIVYWHGHEIDVHPSTRERARHILSGAARIPDCSAVELISDAPRLAASLADGSQRATAIVCFHEMLAVRLLQACWQAGVSVPRDVSILPFNETYLTALTVPPLSTIALPGHELGATAARLLLAELGGAGAPARTLLPARLVARATTAEPRT